VYGDPWSRNAAMDLEFSVDGQVHVGDGQVHVGTLLPAAAGIATNAVDLRQDGTARLLEAAKRKDEFMAAVSHELRQPLHAAQAALLILRQHPDTDAAARARMTIERQISQIARIADDLLEASSYAARVDLRPAMTDLRECVHEAIDTVAPFIRQRGHDLLVDLPAEPVMLPVDGGRIQQVAINLLTNAAKYTRPGGRLAVVLEKGTRAATLRVRDNGVGIAQQDLERIFDLFARAHTEVGSGLGLGLTIARRLVEQHGGTIAARSDGPGHGSEFIVTLPAAAPSN
jgi:two-component system, sensor histidine kinase